MQISLFQEAFRDRMVGRTPKLRFWDRVSLTQFTFFEQKFPNRTAGTPETRTNVEMVAVALPEPFASILKSDFLFSPSPVHHLPRISEALGGKVQIWAKREHANSGIAFGGNKIRKLE